MACRSASVASVTIASVDQPRLSMPRKPERSATRCFWAERGRIPVPEHERAGDRPFAGFRRALEHEGVGRVEPDGSRQFQHVRLIRVSDRAPADHTRPRAPAHPPGWSGPAARCRRAARTSRSPLTSMARRLAGLADGKPRQIIPGDRLETALVPSVERGHQMAGKTFDDRVGVDHLETFAQQRQRRMRPAPPRYGPCRPRAG